MLNIYITRHKGVLSMKLQINKNLRIGLISILILLIITSSFLLFQQVRSPKYEEQKTPVYTYNNKGSINYAVFLKSNNLYEANSLEEGKLYITEFVDHIRTNFYYEFTGERAANLKGKYEIVATVQGSMGEGEKVKDIWEKNYVIVRSTRFDLNDTTKKITEEVKLDLRPYIEFAAEIKQASKINSQTMLTLVMNITVEGTTDKGPIEETISPSLIIPLDTAMFEIGGNATIDKPGVIEETKQVQIPVNAKTVLLYGIIIGLLTLALIFVIFFIKIAPSKDPHEKLLKKIFKNHGDRLVALNSELLINNKNCSYVKSIDDLVKIADEIGKPILYKYSQDYKEIDKFYISHEEQVYILELSEIIELDKVDVSIDEEVKIES